MSRHAVVDAGQPAGPNRSAKWPMSDEELGGRQVGGHKSRTNRGAWTELRDEKDAMRIMRSGTSDPVELLRTIRPESYAPDPITRWAHRVLPIADDQQITVDQIVALRMQYAKDGVENLTAIEQSRWRNLAGMRLAEEAAGSKEAMVSHTRSARKDHRIYGMTVVNGLVLRGFFDENAYAKYEHLLSLIDNYDARRQRRDQLEVDVERVASRSFVHRYTMLGASAVRAVFRFGAGVVNVPAMRIYLWRYIRRAELTGPRVRSSRTFAFGTIVALVGLGIGTYNFFKGGDVPRLGDEVVAGADLSPPDPSATVPVNPPENVINPPSTDNQPPAVSQPNEVQFSFEARQTHKGEGWIQQLSQMNIDYFHPGFMDKIGPWLQAKGYAYKFFDPNSMSWQWGMNLKNIDAGTLKEIHNKAIQHGALKV